MNNPHFQINNKRGSLENGLFPLSNLDEIEKYVGDFF